MLPINNNDIQIFPNPTTHTLHLKIEQTSIFIVEIKDILGKKIMETLVYNNLTSFDISSYPSAVYFITIKNLNKNEVCFFKFIKENNF